jgi:hypothetical protein
MEASRLPDSERPISETFKDVERLMYDVAIRFHAKYGGEFSDWISEGHEIFMKAYGRYDYAKGPFDKWFSFFLNKLFMERVRRLAMRDARIHRVPNVNLDEYIPQSKKSFNVGAFLRDLSNDGKTLAMLVLDTPADIKLTILEYNRNVSLRDKILNGIREFLTDLGWSEDRIYDSYDEVSEALC